jgi:SNF2 family DNA or RNA helicase
VVRDREAINAWTPDAIVLDEAQRIKNWESKTSKEVKKLKSRYAMVLTGTPLENKLEELYSIVQFVDERRFGPAFQFLHEHRVLDENGNLKGYRNLDKIREKLAPIFLRRTRAEVLTQLPERTDNTVFVELSDEQRGPYEEQRAALARLLQKNYLTDLDRKRVLACLVNMRTVCDSTFLFDRQTHVSPKLDEFAELIPEVTGEGDHKAVVFSQWETMAFEAAGVLDRLGVGYAVLHGGLSGKDRKEALERFKSDPACKVFLSTDAGGTGLNLQVADTVVNLELPWNPAVLEQRIARVHRMGQSRPVRVINLVTRGTIEERVLRTLEAKQGLFSGVFEGGEDEIPFEAINRSGFLDTMRELIGEKPGGQKTEDRGQKTETREQPGPTPDLWTAAAHLLEGVCALLAADPARRPPIPDDVRDRLRAAVRAAASYLGPESGGDSKTG